MSGSWASFKAAAEQGDPPDEMDLMRRDFDRSYGSMPSHDLAWSWAKWGLRWARRTPCLRDCCAEQLAMDLRGEGGA